MTPTPEGDTPPSTVDIVREWWVGTRGSYLPGSGQLYMLLGLFPGTHLSLPGLRQEGRSLWVQRMASVKALGLYRVCMFQTCWRSVLLHSDKVEIGLM